LGTLFGHFSPFLSTHEGANYQDSVHARAASRNRAHNQQQLLNAAFSEVINVASALLPPLPQKQKYKENKGTNSFLKFFIF
jgi:hypothetical protein